MAPPLLQDWQCSISMEGLVRINQDVNPAETRKGAMLHVAAVITELRKQPKSMTIPEEMAQFATRLQTETEISNIISDVITEAGRQHPSQGQRDTE